MHLTGIFALVVYGPGLVLSLMSAILPYWSSMEDGFGNRVDIGLWRFCVEGPQTESFCTDWIDNREYKKGLEPLISGESFNMKVFKSTQALEVMGLIFACLGFAGISISGLAPRIQRKKAIGACGILFSVIAGIFTLLGTIIYGAAITQRLDASFVFAVFAGFLFIVAAILYTCDCKVQDDGNKDSCITTDVRSDFDGPVFQVTFHPSKDGKLFFKAV